MSDNKAELRKHYRQLYVQVEPGEIFAFIPGTIMEIFVKKGLILLKKVLLFVLYMQ
jgi:hypothetical protein